MNAPTPWTKQDTESLDEYLTSTQLDLMTRGINIKTQTKKLRRASQYGTKYFATYITDTSFLNDMTLSRYFLEGLIASYIFYKSEDLFVTTPIFHFSPIEVIQERDLEMTESDAWLSEQKKAELEKMRDLPRRMILETLLNHNSSVEAINDIDFPKYNLGYIVTNIHLRKKWTVTIPEIELGKQIEAIHNFYESIKSELI